jgi:precorrin-2 dehydrogenase/sirohydrochlorin ferrochelatase
MNLFPIFLKLAGRRCLVVGGGAVGEGKIAGLLEAGAQLTVVAPEVTEKVKEWASAAKIARLARDFSPADLDGAFLVVAATSRTEVNDFVFREARQRGILCNVVDDPERCDFYYPAVVRRGRLQIAISTTGSSPALARRLRQELEHQFSEYYGAWLEELAETRRRLIGTHFDANKRRRWLHGLASREAFESFVQKKTVGGRP